VSLQEPRVVSGGAADGHLEELRRDPIALMRRVRAECGDVGRFDLAGRPVILLSGAEANEYFFRAPDEDLDQAGAYPFMTPIFGEGVVFDASPERRREALHNQALRGDMMRGHAQTIADEVGRMVAGWGDEGEIDLLDWFAELTIYTSSACLIGGKFRNQLDGRFAELYHDLERGTDALAFVDPFAPIESFRRRDEARAGLVALVGEIMAGRTAAPPPAREDRDLLDVLMSIRAQDGASMFSADEITGMFISMMFAGHHTSSGTAAWTLIELLRHPAELTEVVAELDGLYGGGASLSRAGGSTGGVPSSPVAGGSTGGVPPSVSFQALREIPRLEAAIKEALRLHPPLILLLRAATRELAVEGYRVPAGALVGATPAISNRIAADFPEPDAFRPERYAEPRQEDLINRWTWIPFGAGRHRCVGANFAMIQLKAIFSVLLRDWEFGLGQPADSYRNDHSKMVVQLAKPCVVRYRRRQPTGPGVPATTAWADGSAEPGGAGP
jgi:sterol 14alpha-demethylase